MRFLRALAIWLCVACPAAAQTIAQSPTITPIGFCTLGSLSSATLITTSNCVFASFTGVIANNVLTASAVTGTILPGQPLVGTGIGTGANTPTIQSQLTGTAGGAGTYVLSYSVGTVASESMTTAGVPPQARVAYICAATQGVNWRDDGIAPTATVGSGGIGLASGSCLSYNGVISKWQAIQLTASAVVGVSFYR